MEIKNKVGMKFGRLTVESLAEPYYSPKGVKLTRWLCSCECGSQKVIMGCSLSKIQSCGCNVGDFHGMSSSTTYKAYKNMLERCKNPENHPTYAENGISVCKRWEESYLNFVEDMGERPTLNHSLDRINVKGNYCKENCRWLDDWGTQCFNKNKLSANSSGVTGISWSKVAKKWHAYLSRDKKRVHLGYFDIFEDAVGARKRAEIEYYGFNLENGIL